MADKPNSRAMFRVDLIDSHGTPTRIQSSAPARVFTASIDDGRDYSKPWAPPDAPRVLQTHIELSFTIDAEDTGPDGEMYRVIQDPAAMPVELILGDRRDSLKALRETLSRAQSAIHAQQEKYAPWETDAADLERMDRLIAEIDRQRPLGADGKHSDLHTPTCGCEDR